MGSSTQGCLRHLKARSAKQLRNLRKPTKRLSCHMINQGPGQHQLRWLTRATHLPGSARLGRGWHAPESGE